MNNGASNATTTTDDAQNGSASLWELDASGVPYYKFPPWPPKPQDATILPFRDFKPVGIIVNDNGEEERDGAGIPTVSLPVQHGETSSGTKAAKKRRRAQAEKNARAGIKISWDEQWEESDKAAPRRPYNPFQTNEDKLLEAVQEFEHSRQWNSHLQSCFDFFRQFLGIIMNPNQQEKMKKSKDDEAEMSDDDDVIGEVPNNAEETSSGPIEASIREVDEEYTAAQKLLDAKLDRFLHHPDHAMKVFLSSFFSAKGLLWVPTKLRDAPTLMRFFVDFLLRHSVLPDSRRALERARAVAEQARQELPMTLGISHSLSPEIFGELVKREVGYVDKTNLGNMQLDDFMKDTSAPRAVSADASAKSVEVERNGQAEVLVDVDAALKDVQPVGSGWDTSKETTGDSGWAAEDAAGSGWGDAHPSAWAYGPGPDGAPSAGMPSEPEDWTGAGNVPEKTLAEWLGLPEGTAPGLVPLRAEESTRRVLRVIPPNPGTTGPAARLGTIVLGPWDGPYSRDIQQPKTILEPENGTHEPGTGEINVFVHPDVVDKVAPGFGVHCAWVQVAEESGGKKKKKKGSKGPTGDGWWYIETHRGVFVSYWTVDELDDTP